MYCFKLVGGICVGVRNARLASGHFDKFLVFFFELFIHFRSIAAAVKYAERGFTDERRITDIHRIERRVHIGVGVVFRGGGAFLYLVIIIIVVSGENAYSHTSDNAGVAVVVGISVVVVACGGRIHRNSKVLVFKESRARQVGVRKRSEERAEIIRTVPDSSEVILHVLIEQSAFCRAHRPVLTVVSEIGYRLKGDFVFAFDDIVILQPRHKVAEIFQEVFFT